MFPCWIFPPKTWEHVLFVYIMFSVFVNKLLVQIPALNFSLELGQKNSEKVSDLTGTFFCSTTRIFLKVITFRGEEDEEDGRH